MDWNTIIAMGGTFILTVIGGWILKLISDKITRDNKKEETVKKEERDFMRQHHALIYSTQNAKTIGEVRSLYIEEYNRLKEEDED